MFFLPLKDDTPTARFPVVTVALIVINLLVFGWQLSLSSEPGSSGSKALAGTDISERDEAILNGGAIPERITNPGTSCELVPVAGGDSGGNRADATTATVACDGTAPARQARRQGVGGQPIDALPWVLTLFSSMFLHGGFLHFGFNMLYLWIFGNNIEDSMGRGRFIAFYLLAGLVAVYAQALLDPSSTTPTIGASGAVAGVLGAYALLHPKARVLSFVLIFLFFTFVRVPALAILGAWFLLQLLPVAGQLATPDVADPGGGVAYLAHVGGFIFGLTMISLFAKRRGDRPPRPGT
ncbi:MAG: rhomboid family intramembrane serine protease [Solirubrobacterales bacterium]